MKLEDILQYHVNKVVEVFTDNGFYEGELTSIGNSSVVIQTTSGYYGPSDDLRIFLSKVNHIRVLNP